MYDKRKIIDDVAKMTLEIFTSDFGFWWHISKLLWSSIFLWKTLWKASNNDCVV
jgi:hypothetical protein